MHYSWPSGLHQSQAQFIARAPRLSRLWAAYISIAGLWCCCLALHYFVYPCPVSSGGTKQNHWAHSMSYRFTWAKLARLTQFLIPKISDYQRQTLIDRDLPIIGRPQYLMQLLLLIWTNTGQKYLALFKVCMITCCVLIKKQKFASVIHFALNTVSPQQIIVSCTNHSTPRCNHPFSFFSFFKFSNPFFTTRVN